MGILPPLFKKEHPLICDSPISAKEELLIEEAEIPSSSKMQLLSPVVIQRPTSAKNLAHGIDFETPFRRQETSTRITQPCKGSQSHLAFPVLSENKKGEKSIYTKSIMEATLSHLGDFSSRAAGGGFPV